MQREGEVPTDLMLATAARFAGAARSDVQSLGEGQLCVALRVGEVALRFPRSGYARERLIQEAAVIEALTPTFVGRIPDLVAVELDGPLGKVFVAHRLLPGVPLTPSIVRTLEPRGLSAIGEAIGSFLAQLHASMELVADVPIPVFTSEELARSMEAEVEELLAPRAEEATLERMRGELGALAGVPSGSLGLCHTDIGGNVLYDAASGNVSFIDFGSAMVADPVLDVASLSVLGDDVLSACARVYPLVRERAADAEIVRGTFALQDALYSARQGHWPQVDRVLRSYG